MPRPHSVRFMSGRGGNRNEIFTVPAGRRAVVRSINLFNWSTDPAAQVFFHVHGITVYQHPPGAPKALVQELRLTAFAGETVVITCHGPDWSYSVDGFMFVDSDSTPTDGDNVIQPVLRDQTKPAIAAAG